MIRLETALFLSSRITLSQHGYGSSASSEIHKILCFVACGLLLGTRATHACLLDRRHQNAINRSAVTGGEHRLCQTGLWPCRKCEVELHLAKAAI